MEIPDIDKPRKIENQAHVSPKGEKSHNVNIFVRQSKSEMLQDSVIFCPPNL